MTIFKMKKLNNPQPKTPTPEEIMAHWQQSVKQNDASLKETHSKKEFTFSAGELRQLIKLYTIQTIAEQAIDDKLNNDVLPRMEITPSPQVKILYDLSVGRFVVWVPREKKLTP